MDVFEGIHRVQLSPSPSPVASSGPGYELVVADHSGIAVYSSPVFFGKVDTLDRQASKYKSTAKAAEERCPVGR